MEFTSHMKVTAKEFKKISNPHLKEKNRIKQSKEIVIEDNSVKVSNVRKNLKY
jgi:hypothetical protein